MTTSTAAKTIETTDKTHLQMIRSAATKIGLLLLTASLFFLSSGCSIKNRSKAIKIPEKRVVYRTVEPMQKQPRHQPPEIIEQTSTAPSEIEERELTYADPTSQNPTLQPSQPTIVGKPTCLDGLADYRESTASTEIAERLFFMRRALKVCSSDPFYHLELAKLYDELGRIDDAEHERAEASKLIP